MTNSKSLSNLKDSINWRDIILRAVVPGLPLAIAGFVGEWMITSSSSKSENARLVNNLQIQRERAESDLRKDIFSKSLEALIGDGTRLSRIEDYSKRLLKLELLALNFGDSIFLSPLFSEFEKDLRLHMDLPDSDGIAVLSLLDRLRSLAQRVSVEQLSFLSQRGASKKIGAMLSGDTGNICYDKKEYKWPLDNYGEIKLCRSNRNEEYKDNKGILAPLCEIIKGEDYTSSEDVNRWVRQDAGISLE